MENTFDLAYHSFDNWTSDKCNRMLDALRKRLVDEQEAALDKAGLFERDELFQPIAKDRLRQELLNAQAAYKQDDHMDALAFCNEMERQNT